MLIIRGSFLDKTPNANIPGTDANNYKILKEQHSISEKRANKRRKKSTEKSEKNNKVDWDYTNPDTFKINLGECIGFAYLPIICKVIIDTVIFGRLKYIKQLGVCHCVYPDGNHSRHTHSLGVAHLAYEQVQKLQKQKIKGKPPMTGSEMLCVVIAALCHDLGHGPYSHLCEEFMEQEDGTKLTHEQMSVFLFEKLLEDNQESKNCLDRYLDEKHYALIKDLINPPSEFPETSDKKWKLLVNPEKAFLYAIVNNSISGLDVDKMEYLLRDSKRTGVSGITAENIEMCLSMAKICQIPSGYPSGYKWLAYPENKPKIVSIFFERRQELHEAVYSHRTVTVVSEMMRKAIELALPEIKISNGKKINIPLKECFRKENLDLYIMLTDEYVRTQILYSTSTSHKIQRAQKILQDIDHRRFWRPILAFKRLDSTIPHPYLESNTLKDQLKTAPLSFPLKELLIVRKDFNAGKGSNVNPMDRISFYSRDNGETAHTMSFPKPAFESTVFIIAPHRCKVEDVIVIERILREYSKNYLIPMPIRLFRNDENSV